jgi:hypothetical protein
MKTVRLEGLGEILRGLLDGSLDLQVVVASGGKRGRPKTARTLAAGKAKAKATAKPKIKPKKKGKPGRKPMSEAVRRRKAEKARAAKFRMEKRALPKDREIFLLLNGKLEGMKPSDIARSFKVKRDLLKETLKRLVKQEDLSELRGRFYLSRRLRGEGQAREAKPEPIAPEAVIKYLQKHGPTTMSKMASDMGEETYHRLIRVFNGLKKDKKVSVVGKEYHLA